MKLDHILDGMVSKFERRASLDEGDREALRQLPFRVQTLEPTKYIAREGSSATASTLILSGIAFRHKLTADGARQIVSIHIPGDFVDLEGSLLATTDHNIQTLTRCEVAFVETAAIIKLIDEHPRIGRAMWVDALIDGSIFREWILNVGRRDARARVAHVFCEFALRLEVAGLAEKQGYEFPMTQEQLGDATGLTSVHVNRTIKGLEAEGLVQRNKRYLHIPDWERLRQAADFSDLYLHLDQVKAT
jgi:CRP-like cAMP-binding protein